MKNLTAMLAFSLAVMAGRAQSTLEGYIKAGLDSNLLLKQKSFDMAKAQLALERAKTLFLPQAGFSSQYTLATGGRTQDVPIGDLLNGVYKSLNQLTSTSKFPQVANQSIKFLPNNFQDTKVEIAMPLYNPELRLNRSIKEEGINGTQAEIAVYKRDLVKSIKQAYYQYLQAGKAVDIYTNALAVVNESLRVSEKLVKNNVATRDVILKSQSQVSAVQTSLIDAQENKKNAAAYFNFLLNRPFETGIETDSAIFASLNNTLPNADASTNREELQQIRSGEKQLQTSLGINQAFSLPRLNAFYDVGFQGFGFNIFDKQFYQLGGLQLTWSIFKGNDNRLKVKETQANIEQLRTQYDDAQKQLQLQSVTMYNAYTAAIAALQSARDEMASTKEAYRLTDKKYREGQALQIELIDARIQMTNAEIKYSLAQLNALNKTADVERANATYTF